MVDFGLTLEDWPMRYPPLDARRPARHLVPPNEYTYIRLEVSDIFSVVWTFRLLNLLLDSSGMIIASSGGQDHIRDKKAR